MDLCILVISNIRKASKTSACAALGAVLPPRTKTIPACHRKFGFYKILDVSELALSEQPSLEFLDELMREVVENRSGLVHVLLEQRSLQILDSGSGFEIPG